MIVMKKTQAGMALVEFALVVPILALLLVGLIEVGRFAYFNIAVGNAARAGAQYGAFSSSNAGNSAGIAAAAEADANGSGKIVNITASGTVVCSCWNGTAGTESPSPPTAAACTANPRCTSGVPVPYVQVDASGSYPAMFNYPGLPSTFSTSARAIMRVHI